MNDDSDPWLLYTKDIVKLDKAHITAKHHSPKIKLPISGYSNIEEKIDLHGLTQDQAFEKLKIFLENSSRNNKKEVIIVTGKGALNKPGAIKLALPRWLEYTELKQYITGYSMIIDSLGGSGAIRVAIRAKK